MRHLLLIFCCFTFTVLQAAEIVSVRPLHRGLLLVHFDEGRVIFHGNGQTWNEDRIERDPINQAAAGRAASYRISSTDDANYTGDRTPLDVFRKIKPNEISGKCEGWGNLPFYGVNGCLNADGDRVLEHWIYLELPTDLEAGKTYSLTIAAGVDGAETTTTFTWDDRSTHSEALHVNNLGYTPDAPQKFGYLYHWGGDAGAVDFADFAGQPFHLVNQQTGAVDFTGTVTFRKPADAKETNQNNPEETPNQNFLGAAVWECDFSNFEDVGYYRLSVPGVGASFPFDVGCNALRPAYVATMRALYHNRSGIAKTAPYTTFTRPADHNPALTPGFANRLIYTDFTICEARSSETDEADKADWEAGARGSLDSTYGWYHDAGDWDGYPTHLKIPTQLMLTYGYFPENFVDGELNIPGSGNGIPDILDEASWLPRFFQRLRAETEAKGWSTGGVGGARVMGDLWGSDNAPGDRGRGSWQDTDRDWYVSGEDPVNTFAYAGMAAQLAHLLETGGFNDPDGIDWRAEAISAWEWAEARYAANFSCHAFQIAEKRNYAAAALYQLTDQDAYHNAFRESWNQMDTAEALEGDAGFGAYLYLGLPEARQDAPLATEVLANIEAYSDFLLLDAPATRAARFGGNLWLPMLIGHGTTPLIFEGLMGYAILRDQKPGKADDYLAGLHTTADYFLGTNPLNMTWITGLGERSPEQLFHLDFWHDSHEGLPAGFTPYGPWRRMPGFGSTGFWDIHWPESTLYPRIADWPGHERWFGQQTAPLTAEFTVHQNIVNSAVVYGALAGTAACSARTVSTDEPPSITARNLRVYPNPAEDQLFLENLTTATPQGVSLHDLHGRVVRNFQYAPTLRLGDLPAGVYFLKSWGENWQQVDRIIIQ